MRGHQWGLAGGALALLASCLLSLVPPVVVGRAVDGLTRHQPVVMLLWAALEILGLAMIQGVFSYVSRNAIVGVSRTIEYELKRDFFAHLLRQPLAYYQSRRVGDLISLATNDVSAVRMMTGPAIQQALNTVFLFVGNLVVMLGISVRLTLIALCALPLISLCAKYFGQHIHERFEAVQREFAAMSSRIQETLSGVRVVRAYHQEGPEIAAFERQNEAYLRRNRAIIGLQAFFHPFLATLTGLGAAAVLWAGGVEVVRGHLTLGAFVQFNMYLTRLSWPMVALGWVINLFQRGAASAGRLEAEWGVEPDVVDGPAGFVRPQGTVRWEGAGITVQGRGAILDDVTLEVAPGETLGLVGPTGCGKSTMLHTVPRLHDLSRGTVTVDGVDVREYALAELRRRIGYVTQESFLFSRTLAENIAFGHRAQSDEDRLRDAALAAGLEADLEVLPAGMQTVIGERGVTLSGGQKQRTSLARALLRDPEILLLDDAFSSVDSHTEELILTGLSRVRQGRTTIVVSHRLAALRHADRIAVMQGGRIIAVAPHAVLLSTCRLYADLWEQQRLADELEASNA